MSNQITTRAKNEFQGILNLGGTIDEALGRIRSCGLGIFDSIIVVEQFLQIEPEKAKKTVTQSKIWAPYIKENQEKALKVANDILNEK